MKKVLFLTVCVVLLSGCATILSGTSQDITLKASGDEKVTATVTTPNGEQKVTLPAVVTIKRSSGDIAIAVREADNPCYNTTEQSSGRGFNFDVIGNIITGGIPGTITDLVSGAFWAYDETIIVETDKKSADCK